MNYSTEKTEFELEEEKRLQKAKSSRRIFFLFVVIDIVLATIVLYEIIEITIKFIASR